MLFYKLKIFIRISNYHGYNNYEKKIYKSIINLIKFVKIYKKFSYKIVCPSKELSTELKKKFKLEIVWIPNPIHDFLIKISKKKIKIKKNYYWNLVSVGRLSTQKNHELTINSVSNIIKKNGIKNVRLNIIGEGELKIKLLSLINDLNLGNYVKIIKSQNPHSILKKSDIFISSSLYEGLPNNLLEALCYKKVIVSSACKTGPKEILLNGKFGFLINPNDQFLLEKSILKIIKITIIFKSYFL